ncbi:MAG: fenitrothion hydrolase [Solirubrobacterales bacterium]
MGGRGWRRASILSALAGALALVFAPAAGAHAGLASRADLPIPTWLFAWTASVVLIISFYGLSVLWKQPRLEQEDWRPFGERLSRGLVNPATEIGAGLIGVFLLGLMTYAGLRGTEAPDRNFAFVFLFVTCWLGFPLLSVLLGDLFRPFNPWRAIGRATGGAFRALTGQQPAHLAYPERLGRWPAALGLVAFAWLELIYGAGGTAGLTPHTVAIAALAYSAYTLAMMALFGAEQWARRGETFGVYFNMFSRLSVLAVRDRRLGRRRLLSGAADWGSVPGSVAMVVVSIASTSFDGAQEGALMDAINSTFDRLVDAGFGLTGALRLTDSIYLLLCLAGVAALYLLGVQGMRAVRNAPSAARLRSGFAHTLIPIAFAYLVAHYFSLFVFQEQAQFTYLLSDPLGTGADIFGTAGSGIDYGVISATAVWYVQVAALVIGHVSGLTMAHDRAIAYWDDYRLASRSQLYMLAVMVGFTCFGLFLLSQANQ